MLLIFTINKYIKLYDLPRSESNVTVFRSKVVKKSRHCPPIIYFHHYPGYLREVLKRGADLL